ncbi:MAG: minor capsid protein [Clostridia bacterium]
MKITARLFLPSVEKMMKNCGLNEGGEVQKYIDNFVLEQSEPYMPHKSGVLIASGSLSTKIGSGQVIWNIPYAHYMYEGKLMISPSTGSSWAKKYEEKIYAEPQKTLDYHSGDNNRREHWFDRMIIDKKEELIKGCQKIVDGGK